MRFYIIANLPHGDWCIVWNLLVILPVHRPGPQVHCAGERVLACRWARRAFPQETPWKQIWMWKKKKKNLHETEAPPPGTRRISDLSLCLRSPPWFCEKAVINRQLRQEITRLGNVKCGNRVASCSVCVLVKNNTLGGVFFFLDKRLFWKSVTHNKIFPFVTTYVKTSGPWDKVPER